jgi:aspartate/glutamate/uridylate kinase
MGKIKLVIKIGSMALINRERDDMDYNIISRLSKELYPGCVLVSSGATEIGRLDYMHRSGAELTGNGDENKMDYSSQGQTILMENYRRFIDPRYSVRQVLVEHFHFNDDSYRLMLKGFFERCVEQNAIPIVNYNDAVNMDEIRKFELQGIRQKRAKVVECVDNDETAAQIALLLRAETLVILTSVDGIYRDPKDSSTIIRTITAQTPDALIAQIEQCEMNCSGSSRKGANGARAKLEYVKEAACAGTRVLIANAKYPVEKILKGEAPSTVIGLNLD